MLLSIFALLLAIASVFILPFGAVTAIIAIVISIKKLKKGFSLPALLAIIVGIMICILSIYVVIEFYILNPELMETTPENVDTGGGIDLLTIMVVLATIVLYVISIKPMILRPGYGALAFAILGTITVFLNPYLSLFMALSSLIFATIEFFIVVGELNKSRADFNAGIMPKKAAGSGIKELYRGLSFIALSLSYFFAGICTIFAIREILGLNVQTIDPVTGETSTNANWIFIYLGVWAVVAFFVLTSGYIKEKGPIGALVGLIKYLAIGDWTYMVAYDPFEYHELDNTIVRWLRKYKFFRILINIIFRAIVILFILLIVLSI